MEMETCHQSESYSKALGWHSWVKQQQPSPCPTHTLTPTWLCSLRETGNMVMKGMNSESLGRLFSRPVCVCPSVCARACVCVQLLSWPLRPLLNSTKQQSMTLTSWICTHLRWERRPVPMRQGENEKVRREDAGGGWRGVGSKRQWGTEVPEPRRQGRGEIHPQGKMKQI